MLFLSSYTVPRKGNFRLLLSGSWYVGYQHNTGEDFFLVLKGEDEMEYIQHINPWDVVILCIIIAGFYLFYKLSYPFMEKY